MEGCAAARTHADRPTPVSAKYVVFYCADLDDEHIPYYESIDLEEAYHPQTIMAYELNAHHWTKLMGLHFGCESNASLGTSTRST